MLKGWRTYLVNALNVIAAIVAFLAVFDWHSLMPARYAMLMVMGLGILNIILRSMTTTPPAVKVTP